jgi:hypothetical protein
LGDGKSKEGLGFGGKYLLINGGKPSQMVMIFGDLNVIIGLFF